MGIEPHFKKLRFILSDIIEWGGESIYEIGEYSELKKTNDNVEKKLYEDEQFVIVYRVGGSYLPCVDTQLLCEKIELRQYGEIVRMGNVISTLFRSNSVLLMSS